MAKSNFIGYAYSTVKAAGYDTSKMDTKEVIEKLNEINAKNKDNENTSKNVKTNSIIQHSKTKSEIILPPKEYAQICSAIRTKHTNNIPKYGGLLYNDTFYMYNYNKHSEKIVCYNKMPIVGNETKIKYWEDKYNG